MAQIQLACTLNKPYLPVLNTQQLAYVYLEIKAAEGVVDVKTALNISLVLDKSGSMEGAKIKSLRQAAKNAIDLLEADDQVSIIAFSDRVYTIAPSTPAADKDKLKRQIDRIRDGGGTAGRA